ncbi:MAG: hypothetical protein ABF746_10060 [Acetobacter orientalis]|uniref:hypothetical protein n=1 Tax=Acetobacter orientalis TaxID=146474 RepID=UPI0039EABA25
MKNTPVTPALVFLVVNAAVGVAFVLLPPLVISFLLLLKDIFSVLVLPFTFLFGLAGWSSDMSSLDSVMGGVTPNVLRHPFQAAFAALCIGVGGLCSVLAAATPEGAQVERRLAPVFTLGAMVLGGVDLALILLPCLGIQLYTLKRPGMDFFSRNK